MRKPGFCICQTQRLIVFIQVFPSLNHLFPIEFLLQSPHFDSHVVIVVAYPVLVLSILSRSSSSNPMSSVGGSVSKCCSNSVLPSSFNHRQIRFIPRKINRQGEDNWRFLYLQIANTRR